MQNIARRSLFSDDEETGQSNYNRHVVGQKEVIKYNFSLKKSITFGTNILEKNSFWWPKKSWFW